MDSNRHLILNNGKDITNQVKFCKYNPNTHKYEITFQNNKIYYYNYNSIQWIQNPKTLNPALIHISHGGRVFFNIQGIYVFHGPSTDYWHICFSDGSGRTYDQKDLGIVSSCLGEQDAKSCISYLKQIASINELKNDEGKILLEKQYERLGFIGEDTAMAVYLNPKEHRIKTTEEERFIFPFGGNASQFNAVKNAICSQISVIQGPPGTGKTQTILNIIANLLLHNKTVLVVSNNNSATQNVLEKLSQTKYNLGFLAASLGEFFNKQTFIQNQSGRYPDCFDWKLDIGQQDGLAEKIDRIANEVSELFSKQERLARVHMELDSLLLEIRYFEQYCDEQEMPCSKITPRRKLKPEVLLQLWQECSGFSEKDRAVSFWFKIKGAFIYGISDWGFYSKSLTSIITLLQSLFYRAKRAELEDEMNALENTLNTADVKGRMEILTECSMDYLKAKLWERYGRARERTVFTEEDLWKAPERILKEYPIILSTTFSSVSCLNGVVYDYLIMDEASQVDVATGAMALSCARNAVIVGDLKQLPNIVKKDMKERSDAIFQSYKLARGYSFSENSFLKSVCGILPDAPQTLLREHYRCHPKIIGFCNQKFYDNHLLIMTEDYGEEDVLTVIKTAVGNHRRGHMNQRQIDVLIKEVLPKIKGILPEEIGIIAPYREQVNAIAGQLNTGKVEVETVHKFQGREKNTIVLTTVDDVVTDFSDDPYLLNVAVSRAKQHLLLVAPGNEQPSDSNIQDLISYIEYHNFQVVQSEVYSVFDLLYQQYTEARIEYLRRHPKVSAFDSENIMYGAITDMLSERPHLTLNIICHQPLRMLIRNTEQLSEEERRYLVNTATHVDFLIYNRISKVPVLVIEVDGFRYHKPGTPQYNRDQIKDRILGRYHIPFYRFATNGSAELEQIGQFLDAYGQA
uniref:AAA domain-containing protein n=1 Tax=Enterocloster hominis (ex Hitch et al. 2024) TaxID=1917870 RepID=UPI0010319A84|nr:AAA domain-containing protein [Lachnoclostridium pacaense]